MCTWDAPFIRKKAQSHIGCFEWALVENDGCDLLAQIIRQSIRVINRLRRPKPVELFGQVTAVGVKVIPGFFFLRMIAAGNRQAGAHRRHLFEVGGLCTAHM